MKKVLITFLALALLVPCVASVIAVDDGPVFDGRLTLTAESHLKIENGIIDMIDGTVTVAELKSNFAGEVVVSSAGGEAKADEKVVATDDVIATEAESAKAIIWGDVDRNGKTNMRDVAEMMKYIAEWEPDISETAGDVERDGRINVKDVSKYLKWIAGWEDISLGNVRLMFENKANKVENEDKTLDLFFTNMMNKTGRDQTESTGEKSFKMELGKNEDESCHAIMASLNTRTGLTAELTDFVYEYGGAVIESRLEWVHYYDEDLAYPIISDYSKETGEWWFNEPYVEWHDGHWPEVVLPMADSFELKENRSQHFIITVTSTKDSPAGMYKADLIFKDADGNILKSAPVYAYVHNFTVPDAPYSASLFNTNWSPGEDNKYTYKDYYDYMLDNNLSSYILPYEINEPEADAYMSDPRVTAFVIAGTADNYGAIMAETDEDTKAYFEKVMTNPEWAKKGLFYYTDEPYAEGLMKVKYTYEHLVDVLGTTEGIRNITPLGGNNTWANTECSQKGIDPVEFIKDYINVWCPSSSAYHDVADGGTWTTRRSLLKYGEYRDRAAKFRERGDDLWWYVCCGPEIPYLNLFTWYQGVAIRELMWQQYMNEVEGLLYYATGVHWDKVTKYYMNIENGDGVLMYPGEKFGFEGPCASWRLYQVRDGYDDYDYLKMAEEIVGREEVMKIVSKITTGMLRYNEEYTVLEEARAELIDILVEANENK